jgi:hypothetical protein
MHIHYVAPLDRALGRMKAILFRPFDIGTWIVMGFAAFLSSLGEGGGGWSNAFRYNYGRDEGGDLREAASRALEVLTNPVWVVIIVLAVCIVIALVVLIVWISSRAKFIFLDDVVHDRAAIVEPWRRFQRLGDSLFLWRLVYGLICFLLVLLLVVPLVVVIWSGVERGWLAARILALVGLVLLMAAVVIAMLFVQMLLNNFVIPVMYRDDLGATAAWRKLLPLVGQQFWRFLLYALFVFVVAVGVAAAIFVAGCATLCCGFILLAIPYVGTVLLLPVSVTYRAYGPEFLAQFGPEWSVFPLPPALEPAPAPAPPEGGPLV